MKYNSHNPDILFCLANLINDEVLTSPSVANKILNMSSKQIYGIALTELTSLIIKRTIYCSKTANSNYSHFKFSTSDCSSSKTSLDSELVN